MGGFFTFTTKTVGLAKIVEKREKVLKNGAMIIFKMRSAPKK